MTDSQPRRPYTKSSRSGGSGGNCVEWAFQSEGVYVRDSKNPSGPEVLITHAAWSDFLAAAGEGQEHPWIHRPASDTVHVRKDGYELCFTAAEWIAFVEAIHAGECVPTAAGKLHTLA